MAFRMTPVYSFLNHNKYWIVIIIGLLIVGVLDENSFYKRMKNKLEIADLKEQIETFNEQYEKDEAQLRELRHDPKAITKIARERYFMKADDEDIFVLSTELPKEATVVAEEATQETQPDGAVQHENAATTGQQPAATPTQSNPQPAQ